MDPITINQERLATVLAMTLQSGGHKSIEQGLCVMEAVAYVAGEPWADHPQCACPVIASFLRSWNDNLPEDERQELKQYIPLLVGSKATSDIERKRTWMMTDWVVRECAPIWLRRAGMDQQAAILAGMAPITGAADFRSVRPAIEAIRAETAPARQAFRQKIYDAVKAKLAEIKGAVAAAAADAAAAAAAAAVAGSDRWYAIYWKVRDAVRQKVAEAIRSKLGATRDEARASAHGLVRRLLEAS